jgi:hypothetical protein
MLEKREKASKESHELLFQETGGRGGEKELNQKQAEEQTMMNRNQ